MNVLAITQARIGSTRLPGKVLKKVDNKTLLEIHIDRILKSIFIDKLVVATTNNKEDESIVEIASKCNVSISRGSEMDVLDRFYKAAEPFKPKWIVRLTSDCPLIDPSLIDEVIKFAIDKGLDYCSNTLVERYPDGQDVEVFKYEALESAWKESKLLSEREHVTPYIKKNSSFFGKKRFSSDNYPCSENYNNVRLTIDEKEDYEVIKILIKELGLNASWTEYTNYYVSHKDVSSINSIFIRNQGYYKSLENEQNI
ncbi:MAG: glycosyltransferase family protein [Cyclobacteriaceae bacterium]|nr:glycosyltransferase family protein [Cyclobacteriaceae bacterium]